MFDKNYLGHELIAHKCNYGDIFICQMCKTIIVDHNDVQDNLYSYLAIETEYDTIFKKLTLTCGEMIIKGLLE